MFERRIALLAGTQRNLEASTDSARASEAKEMTSTRGGLSGKIGEKGGVLIRPNKLAENCVNLPPTHKQNI